KAKNRTKDRDHAVDVIMLLGEVVVDQRAVDVGPAGCADVVGDLQQQRGEGGREKYRGEPRALRLVGQPKVSVPEVRMEQEHQEDVQPRAEIESVIQIAQSGKVVSREVRAQSAQLRDGRGEQNNDHAQRHENRVRHQDGEHPAAIGVQYRQYAEDGDRDRGDPRRLMVLDQDGFDESPSQPQFDHDAQQRQPEEDSPDQRRRMGAEDEVEKGLVLDFLPQQDAVQQIGREYAALQRHERRHRPGLDGKNEEDPERRDGERRRDVARQDRQLAGMAEIMILRGAEVVFGQEQNEQANDSQQKGRCKIDHFGLVKDDQLSIKKRRIGQASIMQLAFAVTLCEGGFNAFRANVIERTDPNLRQRKDGLQARPDGKEGMMGVNRQHLIAILQRRDRTDERQLAVQHQPPRPPANVDERIYRR